MCVGVPWRWLRSGPVVRMREYGVSFGEPSLPWFVLEPRSDREHRAVASSAWCALATLGFPDLAMEAAIRAGCPENVLRDAVRQVPESDHAIFVQRTWDRMRETMDTSSYDYTIRWFVGEVALIPWFVPASSKDALIELALTIAKTVDPDDDHERDWALEFVVEYTMHWNADGECLDGHVIDDAEIVELALAAALDIVDPVERVDALFDMADELAPRDEAAARRVLRVAYPELDRLVDQAEASLSKQQYASVIASAARHLAHQDPRRATELLERSIRFAVKNANSTPRPDE